MNKILTFAILFLFIFGSAQKWKKNYNNIMNSQNIYELDAFLKDAHENDPRRAKIKERLVYLMKDYVKTAHPEDQRIKVYQEKLTLLETRSSTKISFDEMNDNIKKKIIEQYKAKLALLENPNLNNEEKAVGITKKSNQPLTQQKYQQGSYSGNSNTSASNKTSYSSKPAKSVAIKTSNSSSNNNEAQEYDALMNTSLQDHKDKTIQVLNKLFDNDPSSKDCIVMIQNKSDCNMIMRIEGLGNASYKLAIPSKDENSIVVMKGDYQFSSLVCGAQYSSQKSIKKGMMVSLDNPKK